MTSLDPAAVIALGDLQYTSGSTQEFTGSYASTWGAFRGRTRPVPGNHEYLTPGAAGYFRYFGRPKPWYRVWNAGQWRVYSSTRTARGRRLRRPGQGWLRRDLTHRSAGVQRRRHALPPLLLRSRARLRSWRLTQFWRIAYAHHVDLALAGHDHDYERFAPMDALRSPASPGRGITSFVSGAGGNSLYHHGTPVGGSQFYQASSFGVLDLRLRPGGFDWAFRTIDRTTPDSGSARCV